MIELHALLLAIILHSSSVVHAHTLGKRDASLSSDGIEVLPDVPSNPDRLWLAVDSQADYLHDQVKDVIDHRSSGLLPSLKDNLKKFEELHHSQTLTHPEVGYQTQEEHEEQHEEAKANEEEGKYQNSDAEKGNEEYEDHEDYEEFGTVEAEKREIPEVHLFGSLGPKVQSTLEQFQHQKISHPSDQLRLDSDGSSTNEKLTIVGDSSHFSYTHPEKWSLDNPECSGRLQSPVNLDSDTLVGLNVPSRLIWTGYWNQPRNLTITDNGHSVELSGSWSKKRTPFIRGGPLLGDYLFAQLHFHWGPKDSVGSEHTINNNSFPMEMHMVHYKRDYGTLKDALKYDDGLAVVAFLFEIQSKPNFGINLLEDSLGKMQNKPGLRIPVRPYPLALFHFIFQDDYASYIGSLTTPPCREIVTWLVSDSPLTVSRKQLDAFRKISNKWPEKENYRPRQALNGRRLYYVPH